MYYLTGKITYSTTGNRTTALNNINSVLASFPEVTGVTTTIASGVNTGGTTDINISLQIPDSSLSAFMTSFDSAWTATARTRTFLGVFRV